MDIFAKLPLNSKLPEIFSKSPKDFSKLTSKKDPLFNQPDIQTLTQLKTQKKNLMMNLMRSISEKRGHLGIQQHEAVAIAKITALIMIASFSHQGKQDIVDAIFNCPQELQTFFINNQDFAKAIASKISTNIKELQEILHQKKQQQQQQQQQLNLDKFTQLSNKITQLTFQFQAMSASGGDTTQIQTLIKISQMQQEEAALKAILYTDDLRTLEPAVLADRSPEDIAKAKSLIDRPFDPNFHGQQVKEQFFCYLLGSDEGKKNAASFIENEIKNSSQSQKNIIIELIRQIPVAQQTEELLSLIPLCRT